MPGLWLSELTLSHFRSHRAETLTLDGRPIAIFGPNGAGKTNILEAVSLISPGRGLRRAAADEMARKPEALGWRLHAVLRRDDQAHEIETRAELGAGRTVRINDKTTSQAALGRICRVVWLIPAMDRLWLEGADGRRRFLDRIALSFEPGHAEVSVAYEKAMRERNRLLKDNVRDPMWYGVLEAQMAEAGAAIVANRQLALTRIEAAQDGAQTSFPAANLSIAMPDGVPDVITGADLEQAFGDSRTRDLAAGRTLIGPHRADLQAIYAAKEVPAKQCSTGEQKALLLSLILANARALAEDFGAPPIMLLDEVAAHLDATRRAALYEEVIALKAQAWMTGTGAELFTELGRQAQSFEVTEIGGVSKVTPGANP